MNIQTRVVAAFPGTGKSTYCRNHPDCSDSDSSKFDKAEFPQNYIEHIKSLIGKKTYVFVSSHKAVRDALLAAGIPFNLVIPTLDCKEEYLKRFKERGNPESFIKLISDNWETWISDCATQQKGVGRVVVMLSKGTFLSDAIDKRLI